MSPLRASRDYAIGDLIVELRGAAWTLAPMTQPSTDAAASQSNSPPIGFCIPTAKIEVSAGCPSSFNAVYIGPEVDAIVATTTIPCGGQVRLFTCLVAYRFPGDGGCTCPCGCGREFNGFSSLTNEEQQAFTYLTEPVVRRDAYASGYLVRSASQKETLEIRPNGEMGLAVFARRHISKGTELFQCGGLLVPRATMYTIQVGVGTHALFGDGAECIAHSCDPNVIVIPLETPTHDLSFRFVAHRDISAGELLGFNYQSTEWSMQQSFDCLCGAAQCFGRIAGFARASEQERARMWAYASPVMKAMVQEQEQGKHPNKAA